MKVAILIFTLFLISCNSNDSKTDTDNAIPDKDSVAVIDSETQDEDTESETPDTGTDADSEAECIPPLIEAPFPYYDKDGNITFCRPDCNEATEKDPQCMSNLWKEQNQALCKQKPKYDCCGYPCVMESFKPMTKEETDKELVFEGKILVPMHKCDLFLSLWDNDGTHGVVKSWNMSEGKIGFHLVPTGIDILEWPNIRKAVTYDIETKKYSFIAPGDQMQSYHKGKRILLSGDKRPLPIDTRKKYLTYMGDDGSLGIVYPEAVEFLAYEPALNDKWAFVNLTTKVNSSRMMYAKVGDPSSGSTADSWKWTVLGEGYGWFPALVGNKLSFTDDDVNGWICDLSKNPQKLSDCIKFNKEGERAEYLYFDRENENRFAYYSTFESKIVLAEKEGEGYKKTDLITEFTEASVKNGFSILPRTLRKNLLLYEEVTTDGSQYGGLLCYYRIDKKKKYCMKKMDNDETYSDGTTRFPYGYAEFEGKWLLYQKRSSTPLILRDMECYCKEEGVCPFE
ncbi:MAG TPA: hypothetical protein VLJ60_07205 [bacterium]|nr:hypothetical protein [bacterium]